LSEQPSPHEEPAMPQEQPTPAYEAIEDQDDWLQEPELPPRPRRRLLGVGGAAGGTPIIMALLAMLLIACGFIGGVLVEKGQGGSSPSTASGAAASLASRFRALRGGTGSTGGSGIAGGSSSSGAGFTRPTAGTVAYLAGSTLYVTNSEGNTVKVTTSAATSVTKTVRTSVKGIHPGEAVTITGTSGSDGAISAESISVGSGGGGLAALFGAGAGTGASRSGGNAGSSGGGSEPPLFGNGG
jgi:hypothetical protein